MQQPPSTNDTHAWPELTVRLIKYVEAEYERLGMEPEAASFFACMGVIAISTIVDGNKIYLPKAHRIRQEIIRRRVCERFNGRNRLLLAQEYGLKNSRSIYNMWHRLREATANAE